MIASRAAWLPAFSAQGVITEFLSLLMVPLIALMRTGAMQVAPLLGMAGPAAAWRLLKPIRGTAMVMSVVLGLSLTLTATWLGIRAYHLDGARLRWWCAFATMYGLGLPLLAQGSLVRACYQACEHYGRITWVEIFATWILLFPCLRLALQHANPWAFFLAYLAREGLVLFWLRAGMGHFVRGPFLEGTAG